MKKIYITTTILLAMIFAGCGGGGGSGGTAEGSGTSNITITPCATYIPVYTGDTIVKDSDGTSVEVRDTDGQREICVLSGSAHIVRK